MRSKRRPSNQKPVETEEPKGHCVYCGNYAVLDRDHVPPEAIFPKPRPSNLRVVPSCKSCNRQFSKDDEYFRTVLSLLLDGSQHAGHQQIIDKTFRAFRRPESAGLKHLIFDTMQNVEMRTPSGLYYGNGLGFTCDLVRIRSTCNRIIKGLYFIDTKECLPKSVSIHTEVIEPVTSPGLRGYVGHFLDLALNQPRISIGEDIFSYSWLMANDNKHASAWALIFFNKVLVFGMVTPEILPNPRA